MADMESLWPRLAELPLVVESCEYDRLHAVLAHDFQRVTTHVRLVGAGADGLGEDVSVHVENGKPYVYRIVDGVLQRTPVTTGLFNLTDEAITSGLAPG